MLWRQEPCPAFESTFDVGNWYRATTETDTQTTKDPNENAQHAKNNSSATCVTSGDKENESDWETCSDCSTDSDSETNKIMRGKEDVREDVTETLQENTNDEETIQPAETGVETSTSASPNKVKKKVGRPKKSAHPVNPSTPPAHTEQVARKLTPPHPTHHPPTGTTNENSNENSTPGNEAEQLGKRIRRRPPGERPKDALARQTEEVKNMQTLNLSRKLQHVIEMQDWDFAKIILEEILDIDPLYRRTPSPPPESWDCPPTRPEEDQAAPVRHVADPNFDWGTV
ncbi:hypothetical protein DAPPUDRAFT_104909 [Daphnia pulex]|uniref:Uncharacterized protein n=1 Tax=Daphnia pulex TaxID=6669 RepID=E9GNR8_DAPPU|nr:hypothetical protein DAPPUDRAFT_104909 [Daphnia pulex]|eukprot:EFX78905.1 hypothetical protein DAPPUDRAFT_104909 [Daphnia pulex]